MRKPPSLLRKRPSRALAENRRAFRRVLVKYRLKNPRVFGSVARSQDTVRSDLDLLVDTPRSMSLLDMVGAEHAIQDKLRVKVSLLTPNELSKHCRESALAEAVPLRRFLSRYKKNVKRSPNRAR
jgi:predicted nucleotidyltransferase